MAPIRFVPALLLILAISGCQDATPQAAGAGGYGVQILDYYQHVPEPPYTPEKCSASVLIEVANHHQRRLDVAGSEVLRAFFDGRSVSPEDVGAVTGWGGAEVVPGEIRSITVSWGQDIPCTASELRIELWSNGNAPRFIINEARDNQRDRVPMSRVASDSIDI